MSNLTTTASLSIRLLSNGPVELHQKGDIAELLRRMEQGNLLREATEERQDKETAAYCSLHLMGNSHVILREAGDTSALYQFLRDALRIADEKKQVMEAA